MNQQTQSHIIASVGTIVSLCLVFLFLWWMHIDTPERIEDEGIVITFGDAEEGGGMPDALPVDPVAQTEQIPAPAAPAQPSNNDLMVQDTEDALALAQQTEEEQKNNAQDEELLRKQREEQARAEAERIAKEKALAEQKAKEQEAIQKAQLAVAMFGQAGTNTGANAENATSTPAATSKGNPVGKSFGQVNGNMWSLHGRTVKAMPKPSSDFKEEGKVIVSIRVDKAGNVVLASIAGGTTIGDQYTQQLALEAARKAKFTEGDNVQTGTITYNFKLN